jgi:hypothetical protein
MASIKLQGDVSGELTISAPAVAGTNTLTLPASSGTLLDSTSTLDATKLTGDLPAISGANLTDLPASGLGVGQTWQDVSASRSLGVTYTNSTGKPIEVLINRIDGGIDYSTFLINGVEVSRIRGDGSQAGYPPFGTTSITIPNGDTYEAGQTNAIQQWWELR